MLQNICLSLWELLNDTKLSSRCNWVITTNAFICYECSLCAIQYCFLLWMLIMCNSILLPVMNAHYVQSNIAFCYECTLCAIPYCFFLWGSHTVCATQPCFKGSLVPRPSHHPVFDCLQYMICQNWTVGRPSKVMDRSSTLTGDHAGVYGRKFNYM